MTNSKPIPKAIDDEVQQVSTIGLALLENPLFNKGTAFTEEERDEFALQGLLPMHVSTLEEQVTRAYQHYQQKTTNLERNIYLTALHDRNETLFFQLMQDHVAEMVPMIYTPVEAIAIEQFSHVYRRPRGLFISYPERHKIQQILENYPNPDVEAIVATDAEQILGIGDQGIGGIGISVGKLAIYTVCAGIHPATTLPIVLDVGTDRQAFLDDPLYLGWRHTRLRGEEYDEFIATFVQAVKAKWPKVFLQWEDFGRSNARRIIDRYRNQLLTFNDDMQGTGAVALAALMAAFKVAQTQIRDQQVVIFGAGTAGSGIADQICAAMVRDGLSEDEARKRLWLIDKEGLLHTGVKGLPEFQQKYLKPLEIVQDWQGTDTDKITLADVVKHVHPTILIGTSTQPKSFTEEIVREMASHVERPIIFPLSNPTELHEAVPEDLINWTEGRALVATGSPFAPVDYQGRTMVIGECNNCLIFPGLALGAIASQALHVSDEMIEAASLALSECAPAMKDPSNALVPSLDEVREVSRYVAIAVGQSAQKAGLAEPIPLEELTQKVDAKMWTPRYRHYRKV